MDIVIRTIPHTDQRYDTVGDWWFEGDTLQVRVSAMDDWKAEGLVAHHELTEALLCKARGITADQVDEFDKAFNKQTAWGQEPGDHPDAPYRREHFFATTVERMLSAELGVDWFEYDDKVSAL